MSIGRRIRILCEQKGLSQGDIEEAIGLLRCYTSREENGHTVPRIETLEKYAKAFEIPLYLLFYEGEGPPELPPCHGTSRLRSLFKPVRARMPVS